MEGVGFSSSMSCISLSIHPVTLLLCKSSQYIISMIVEWLAKDFTTKTSIFIVFYHHCLCISKSTRAATFPFSNHTHHIAIMIILHQTQFSPQSPELCPLNSILGSKFIKFADFHFHPKKSPQEPSLPHSLIHLPLSACAALTASRLSLMS